MHVLSDLVLAVRRPLRRLRRQVQRRRRPLAALLVATAVFAGLRVTSPPPPASVTVPVAARDLPAGARLGADDVTTTPLPPAAVPDGMATESVGQVLASPVTRGEPLTAVRLVGPALAQAQVGDVVLPVRLPDAGMAALLEPGDVIDLLATDPGTGDAEVAASDVMVLAVPTGLPDGPAGGGAGGALVVVSVRAGESLEVTSAALSKYLTVGY